MQLHIEYSQITNQTLQSFSQTVQTFQLCISVALAHSAFKQSVQNVHQLQQHMINVSCCLDINELCSKSFQIVNKTVFQPSNVGQLWRVFLISL